MRIKGKQLEDTLRSSDTPFDVVYTNSLVGDVQGAVRFVCKNGETNAISKGQAVYISGVSGDVPIVKLADADGVGTIPAIGLTDSAANANAEVGVVSFGNLTGIDTDSLNGGGGSIVGKPVYVDTVAGSLTVTAPAGNSAQLQNIGQVVREHANEGVIKVGGAGRTAATPNLDSGRFFVGNGSNQSSQSVYSLPTSDGSANQLLQTNGSGAVSFSTPKSSSYIGFGQEQPLTDQTSIFELKTTNGAQNGQGWRMPVSGEITHVSLQGTCSISNNTVVLYLLVYKNGVQQTGQSGITVSSAGSFGDDFELGTAITFSAGDRISLRMYHNVVGATTDNHAGLIRIVTDTY